MSKGKKHKGTKNRLCTEDEEKDEDDDQSRDDEDSTNLGNFLQHGHEHASRHRPDDFLPINGFSSETGLKSLHYSDNEFDYHLLNIWP